MKIFCYRGRLASDAVVTLLQYLHAPTAGQNSPPTLLVCSHTAQQQSLAPRSSRRQDPPRPGVAGAEPPPTLAASELASLALCPPHQRLVFFSSGPAAAGASGASAPAAAAPATGVRFSPAVEALPRPSTPKRLPQPPSRSCWAGLGSAGWLRCWRTF